MRVTGTFVGVGSVLAAAVLGCSSKGDGRQERVASSSTTTSAPLAPVETIATQAPPAASAPSRPISSAVPDAEPLAIGDPKAARAKIAGALVFSTPPGEEPAGLYVLPLEGAAPKPKLLAAATGEATNLEWPSISPDGKQVVYTRAVPGSAAGTTRGEVATVPLAGGTAHGIVRCTETCRAPAILGDGRVVYVDHGPGLTQATVRFVKAGNKELQTSSVFFGGAKELATCSITIEVDRAGGSLLVNVNNELGWPECNTDASWLFDMRDLKKTKLERPPPTRGSCASTFGDDGRIYVGGYECAPGGSFAADGSGPLFPDPKVVDGAAPTTRWTIVQKGDALIATPPKGDPDRAFVVFEGKVASFTFRPK